MADKLDRFKRMLQHQPGGTPEQPDDPEPEPLREDTGPGLRVRTEYGPVRVLEQHLETAIPYAPTLMSHILTDQATHNCRYLKDERLRGFKREEALFLDVETTGLSHGAGTVAFLIGLGWFDGDVFVLQQLLLEDYDQEQAQLRLLLDALESRTYLVTYNGKSFDRSILESRLVVNRFMDLQEAQLRLMPHLDLLHLGRRVHRGTLDNHTLGTMERRVLGFERGKDIPGEMVPQLYFHYLLSRDWEHVKPVIKHNFDDVLSLAHLADSLLQSVDPDNPAGEPSVDFNLGRLFFQTGFLTEAMLHLEAAMPRVDAAKVIARIHRKTSRDWGDTLELWQEACAAHPDSPVPWVELSKLHEWKSKDLPLALECAKKALALDPEDEKLLGRVDRIDGKQPPIEPATE